jgi:hypothetical protein
MMPCCIVPGIPTMWAGSDPALAAALTGAPIRDTLSRIASSTSFLPHFRGQNGAGRICLRS